MKLDLSIVVIIVAILIGVCLFQRGAKNANMSDAERKEADMYRIIAYLLFAIAGLVGFYYFFGMTEQKASMCGYKAQMCGAKAQMCGLKHY